MLVWVLYDIKNNKKRNKLYSICKNFGLFPIQKSVFLGSLDLERKDVFFENINKNIDENDSVIIIQTTKNNVKNSITFGKKIDFELPLREKLLMFF